MIINHQWLISPRKRVTYISFKVLTEVGLIFNPGVGLRKQRVLCASSSSCLLFLPVCVSVSSSPSFYFLSLWWTVGDNSFLLLTIITLTWAVLDLPPLLLFLLPPCLDRNAPSTIALQVCFYSSSFLLGLFLLTLICISNCPFLFLFDLWHLLLFFVCNPNIHLNSVSVSLLLYLFFILRCISIVPSFQLLPFGPLFVLRFLLLPSIFFFLTFLTTYLITTSTSFYS